MKKKIVAMTLAILMCTAQVVGVSADTEQELREQQAWTYAQLDATYDQISQLWYQKSLLESQIESLNSNLVDIMVSIDLLKSDIESKQTEIENTQKNLEKAEKARDNQYEAMKKRIQYLYEKGGSDAWLQMMMSAENLSDLLSKAEYTQKMYDYDRENLDTYVNTIKQVELLEEKYKGEKAELEAMEQEMEAEQANLEYEISVTRAASANCDDEIAYAQYMASQYEAVIVAQQAEIERLEAERIAYEAAVREQALAQAAASAGNGDYVYDENGNIVYDTLKDEYGNQVKDLDGDPIYVAQKADGTVELPSYLQEEYAPAENSSSSGSSSNTGSGDYMYDENGDIVYTTQKDEYGNEVYDLDGDPIYVPVMADGSTAESSSGSSSESSGSSSGDYEYDEYGNVIDTDNTVSGSDYVSSGSSYSGAGSSVVDFATQFVGNPYVWGGTSLTNGADCSGFVQSVYSNFGISLPRTSYEQQNAGYEVSYADAQPGDLICYGGHVAIYMGNGQIVHASNSRDGIKISNDATYRTILSVRRLVD